MNDVATAVSEIEAVISELPVRVSIGIDTLKTQPTGSVLLLAGDADSLQNTSADSYMYFDGYSSGTETLAGYSLTAAGQTDNYVSGIDPFRVVAIEHTSYETWRSEMQWKTAVGKFSSVTPAYMPRAIRDKWALQGIAPARYKTFLEVVAVDMTTKTITARMFSTQSETPEAVEYGTHDFEINEVNITLITAERFKAQHGLSKDVWPVGSYLTYESQLYTVTENKGASAVFQLIEESTGDVIEPLHAGSNRVELTTEYSKYIVKQADNKEHYIKTLPSEDVRDAIILLSRNTVTRALKHADSNDYCSETAVALTSAGHAMPEIRVRGTITIPVDFTSKEYMFLRKAFGLADDTVSNLDAVLKTHYGALSSRVNGLPSMDTQLPGTTMDLTTEVLWKTPKLRPVN